MRQHPDISQSGGGSLITTVDNHHVGGRIVDRAAGFAPGGSASAGRQLRPDRCSTESVGIAQHPDIIEETRSAITSTENDHAVGVGIVDGCVPITRNRRSTRASQWYPAGRPSQPVGILQNPHVVLAGPWRAHTQGAAEDYEAAVGGIVNTGVTVSRRRRRPGRIDWQPMYRRVLEEDRLPH